MTREARKGSAARAVPLEEGRRRAESRSNCYGLLALVFRDAPTAEVVTELRAPPLAEALSRGDYDAARDLAGEPEEVAERLGEEYTRVFIGPGSLSLFASVHHEGEGQLWGNSTVRAKRFIEATGLSFEGRWDSIPDHIAVELELMQRLAAHEAELWGRKAAEPAQEGTDEQLDRCLEVEAQFLREHLSKWIPGFCDRAVEKSTVPFYREMAELTKSFVLTDLEETEAMLNELEPEALADPGH